MKELFDQLTKDFLAELQVESFKDAPRYSATAFRWYCYEFLGMPASLLASELNMVPKRVQVRFTEMSEAARKQGTTESRTRGFQPYVELADDLARDLGIKPKSFTRMTPFEKEYRQWEVCQAFGKPNCYVDADESTPFVADEMLNKIAGMDRKTAIEYISQNFGVYKL